MPQRVFLDAMIPREDFSVTEQEFELDLKRELSINDVAPGSAISKVLRKPDFQRETNHWTPEQVLSFIASFLDNEVIPSLILWKSPSFIFVIDGGHRLSALRAWVEDDYGDGHLSMAFYKGEISDEQRKIAKRTRNLVEQKIGRYTKLQQAVSSQVTLDAVQAKRAGRLVTRILALQWIQGNAEVAETSFYKINSQGTPLDATEEMLIRNRRKPIAIAARAILRSGTGHKYWSAFDEARVDEIEMLSRQAYELLFEPESSTPLRTLDVSFGGPVSPVDALSLLIEFLTIAGERSAQPLTLARSNEDKIGDATISVLKKALEVLNKITGNSPGSLGLHPAIYFYNERGKYSRFLFLGMVTLLTEKIRNNDSHFFKKFSKSRTHVERFLVENKATITLLLQNMSKGQRVPQMHSLFGFLISSTSDTGHAPSVEAAMNALGLQGRILDLTTSRASLHFSDETKSQLFIETATKSALKCSICDGYLQPTKSISYDHKVRVRDGGNGHASNGQLVHPYCNTSVKS
jgi:hypothetical protein